MGPAGRAPGRGRRAGAGAALWLLLRAQGQRRAGGADPAGDGGLRGVRAVLPPGPALERLFRALGEASRCSHLREPTAGLESNRIFDGTWDAESGEVHEAVRDALRQDPGAYFFMVNRAFTSGVKYVQAEQAYLGCLARRLERHGLRKYLDILGAEGLDSSGAPESMTLLATLLLAAGFEDGTLVIPQHLNELTVRRMQGSISEFLTGDRRREALALVSRYGDQLPALEEAVAKVAAQLRGRLQGREGGSEL